MNKNITPEQLNNWRQKKAVALVDVRAPDEFVRGHIPGAVNIPQAAITSGVLSKLSADRIVLYCNTGNRSSQARQTVNENYDLEVYNLAGGIERWQKAGGSPTTSQLVSLPLQRQVQVAVSMLVLLGVGLGFFWRPEWYLLSVFVGLGLLNAGLTGWCGMARLLAYAPWNR